MDITQLGALILFAFVSTFTPGPNNLMLMTSGANVGFKRTIPHMLGITLGFGLMVFLVGLGLMGVFTAYPALHTILKWLSFAYLGYLAFKIATSGRSDVSDTFKPMTFLQAASFQWVNPKGWSMALSSVSIFSQSGHWLELVMIAAAFMLTNIPSCSAWVVAGREMQRLLTSAQRVRVFNVSMALLLVGSTLPMIGLE